MQRGKQYADLGMAQMQLDDQKQQMEAITKIKAENEAQLEKVRQEQKAAASANKQRMLAQLNATLNTIGSTYPGQSVVLPQAPQGDAANDATKQSEYEAKLMETTINSIQHLHEQNNTANMEAQNNKLHLPPMHLLQVQLPHWQTHFAVANVSGRCRELL